MSHISNLDGSRTSVLHAGVAAAPAASARAGEHTAASKRDSLVRALLTHVPNADRVAASTAIPAILTAARKAGTTDVNQVAYLLATAQTESDFGANMTETGHTRGWFNAHYGGEDGNRPGTDDGYTYRGRGYVQATHAGRYAEISRELHLPDVPVTPGDRAGSHCRGDATVAPALVAQPERLAQPRLAAQALVLGVKQNAFTHNADAALEKTIPAGKPPGDADFYHARAIVNGIVRSQAQAVATHATAYAQILAGYRHSVLEAR